MNTKIFIYILILFYGLLLSRNVYADTTYFYYDELNRPIETRYEPGVPDSTPPVTTASPVGGVFPITQPVTLRCTDIGLGCERIYYTTNGSAPTTASTSCVTPCTVTIASTTTLKFFSRDLHQNSEAVKTELYQITPPTTPTNPSIPIGSQRIMLNPTLQWSSSGAESYDVYFGTSSTPPYLANTTTSSYPISSLLPGRLYYWKIVAKNGAGSVESPLWSFTTITCKSIFDMNGDGYTDILWRHMVTGDIGVWYMNGINILNTNVFFTMQDFTWKIEGTADMNCDGSSDLVWRQYIGNGSVATWLMNGTTRMSTPFFNPSEAADLGWKIVGTGDFDGDGLTDLLWRNDNDGAIGIWKMNQLDRQEVDMFPTMSDLNWKIIGVGDFSGDGKPDILWMNLSTGDIMVWVMNGISYSYTQSITPGNVNPSSNWRIKGVGDYNSDNKPDILWQNTSTGEVGIWLMNNFVASSTSVISTVSDLNWQIMGPK